MSKKWIKLSNGIGCRADLVAAIGYAEESHRVFLKSESGEILCSIRCESEAAAELEIQAINQQLT